MDDLTDRLRAASDAPPPSRIDLDSLIDGEQRRSRQRRWLAAATGAAAVAVLMMVPAALSGWGGGTSPAGGGTPWAAGGPGLCAPVTVTTSGPPVPLQSYDTVRPRPTEEPAAAVERLSVELADALEQVLPAGLSAEPVLAGCGSPQFQYHPSYRRYEVALRLADRRGSEWFRLELLPTGVDDLDTCTGAPGDCVETAYPDGATAEVTEFEPYPDTGAVQRQVLVRRADGTLVLIVTSTGTGDGPDRYEVTRQSPSLTVEQLAEIGRWPGLTLHP